jgi:hypothetical protein
MIHISIYRENDQYKPMYLVQSMTVSTVLNISHCGHVTVLLCPTAFIYYSIVSQMFTLPWILQW